MIKSDTLHHIIQHLAIRSPAEHLAQVTTAAHIGDLDRVVDLLEQQPINAAHIMRLANSTAYSTHGLEAEHIRQAVTRVGLHATAAHLIARDLADNAITSDLTADHRAAIGDYFDYAARVAKTAGIIAADGPTTPELAITAGLLHNIGEIAILSSIDSVTFDQLAAQPIAWRINTEHQLFDFTHNTLGAAMLQSWRFAPYICATAEHYQRPAPASRWHGIMHAVYCATWLQQTHPDATAYWHRAATQWPPDFPVDKAAEWLLAASDNPLPN